MDKSSASSLVDLPAIGTRVEVNGVNGIVRYAATTKFAVGFWVGIELDAPAGKNDGSVMGQRYFETRPNHGVFVRPAQVKIVAPTASGGATIVSNLDMLWWIINFEAASKHSSPTRSDTPDLSKFAKAPSTTTPTGRSVTSIAAPSSPGSAPSKPLTPTRSLFPTDSTLKASSKVPVSPTSRLPSSPTKTSSAAVPSPSRLKAPNTTMSGTISVRSSTPVQSAISSPHRSAGESPKTVASDVSALDLDAELGTDGDNLMVTHLAASTASLLDELPPHEFEIDEGPAKSGSDDDIPARPSLPTEPISRESLVKPVSASKPFSIGQPVVSQRVSESVVASSVIPSPVAPRVMDVAPSPPHKIDTAPSTPISTITSTILPAQEAKSVTSSLLDLATPSKTVPLRELEDLKIKLRILESKRAEDRDLMKEHERLKTELESTQLIRARLSERLEQVQEEVRESKRQLKESIERQQKAESQVSDLSETLEMMTLDKEVAEEKTESLQSEVEALKEKVEELSLDLEVMKEEASMNPGEQPQPAEGADESRPTVEIVQLERQNERLKEALVKLRDVATTQEFEARVKIQHLEHEIIQLSDYKDRYSTARQELEMAQTQVEDLKMQLDDALGSADLVDQLTDKNLQLSERVEELAAAVEDLEALKELNDEIEENHLETEKQLQTDIDSKEALLRDVRRKLELQDESMADYERTMSQFRELVSSQEKDIEQLKRTSKDDGSVGALSSQTQAMISLNLQLQSSAVKAQVKSIELELRKLEAQQALDHLDLVLVYLPDVFNRNEAQPVNTLLMFRRVAFKANLFVEHILEYVIPENDSVIHGQHLAVSTRVFAAEAKQKASLLYNLANRFVVYMQSCSDESFIRIGRAHDDLVGVERRLNAVVDSLKNRDVERPEVLTELQRSVTYLEHLAEKEATDEGNMPVCIHQLALAFVEALEVNAQRMDVEISGLEHVFVPSDLIDDSELRQSLTQFGQEFVQPWYDLKPHSQSIRVVSRKLIKHLLSLKDDSKAVSSDFAIEIRKLSDSLTQAVECLAQVVKSTSRYVADYVEQHQPITLNALNSVAAACVESCLGTVERAAGSTIYKRLELISIKVMELDSLSVSGELVPSTRAPWHVRAEKGKTDMASSSQLEGQIDGLNDEIVSLALQIKMKEQNLAESAVKVEILEKRIEILQKQTDSISELEEELSRTRERQKVNEEALDNVLADMKELEEENTHLKRHTRSQGHSYMNTGQGRSLSPVAGAGSSNRLARGSPLSRHDLHSLGGDDLDVGVNSQIQSLQSALRYLRAENTRLKTNASSYATASLFAPTDPVMRQQRLHSSSSRTTSPEADRQLKAVALESRVLARDAADLGCEPRLVDVSQIKVDDTNKKKWSPLLGDPALQYYERVAKLEYISKRGKELRERVRKIAEVHGMASDKYASAESNSMLTSTRAHLLGRISIPIQSGFAHDSLQQRITLTTHQDFERLHTIFVS
ncbi:hypothetical protein SmJEL517_g02234 [Synchytrium microbalum]|uniref:CAP-Gly domain-containing protein n=1 Tax=Synchytrium microbalum TaxID=1806994 RepID=A0A507C805_9FUNG|nr:uncharacterized protein SmJEL517_g02234 [Synchytrium microbalum]TPX35279.1 hypothetical protein SmJEL517_g02234 [Synchytrium microbalum]